MATSGTVSANSSAINSTVTSFTWSTASTDIDRKTTTISWTVNIRVRMSSYAFTNESFDVTVQVGDSYYTKSGTYSCSYGQTVAIASGTTTIQHDESGNAKTIPISVLIDTSAITVSDIVSKSITIDAVYPSAKFVSIGCNSTNDESLSQITFTYKVPKASATTSLRLGIDYGNDYTYVNLNKNGTTYTHSVTAANKEILRQNNTTQTYGTINFHLESVVNGETYDDYSSTRINIINAEPTFTATIVDTNTTVTNLTGNANILVRDYSNAEVTVTSSPKKHAYIESERVVNGSNTLEYGSGTIYNVDSGEFVITVVDSRGLSTTQTIYKTYVNYIPISCNMEVDIPSSTGSTTVRLKGNCFYGSFGRLSNTLTVRYRYKPDGGSYTAWKSSTVTIANNNTYSTNISVTGLDYTKGYTFEAQAEDRLNTATSVEIKVKSTPIFDWGENDFNFNVPVNFAAGFTTGDNTKQLWNGQNPMNSSSDTITLIEPVSSQANGIVLIFTPYDSSTGLANDGKLQSFFISKGVVKVMPSKMHTFMLLDGANFATVGAKSLYIGNERISGYANNSTSASASSSTGSIKYDNTKFVLRWVLGV